MTSLRERDINYLKMKNSNIYIYLFIPILLRDGICTQSASSDIYSFGKLVNVLIKSHVLHNTELEDLSHKCMQYHSISRPNLHGI